MRQKSGQGALELAKEPQFFPSPVLSELTHPPQWSGCCSQGLPFSESSLPRPAAGWFCSAESDGASGAVPDPSVPPAWAAPGPAARCGNTLHHIYFQLKTFLDGNCNLYVLALPFCSGNAGAVRQGGRGGQRGCHSWAGRGGVRLALPAAFWSVFWVEVNTPDIDLTGQLKGKSESLCPGWPGVC